MKTVLKYTPSPVTNCGVSCLLAVENTSALQTRTRTGVYIYYHYGPNNANAISPGKATLDTGIGVYGLIMNPAVAVTYFGTDLFYRGGWPGFITDWHNSLNPKNNPLIDQMIIQTSMNP